VCGSEASYPFEELSCRTNLVQITSMADLSQTDNHNCNKLSDLIDGVRENDCTATEELCRLLASGIRFIVLRRVGVQDFEDTVQDVLIDVLNAIKHGKVQHPTALVAFARTIAIRKCAAYIAHVVAERARTAGSAEDFDIASSSPALEDDPEGAYFETERAEIAHRVLSRLKSREREVLQRFYVDEHSPEQICRDMDLTETQFRLLKSRAKNKFGELGRALQKRGRLQIAESLSSNLRRCA
jgi:RNA polymerase sigma-70 factor, ECF subfamily